MTATPNPYEKCQRVSLDFFFAGYMVGGKGRRVKFPPEEGFGELLVPHRSMISGSLGRFRFVGLS